MHSAEWQSNGLSANRSDAGGLLPFLFGRRVKAKKDKQEQGRPTGCLVLLFIAILLTIAAIFLLETKTRPGYILISGQVRDQNESALADARVELEDSLYITGSSGAFSFEIPQGDRTATIRVSHPDYRDQQAIEADLSGSGQTHFNVILSDNFAIDTRNVVKSARGTYQVLEKDNWSSIKTTSTQLLSKRLRLIQLETNLTGGKVRYSGLWLERPGTYISETSTGYKQFQTRRSQIESSSSPRMRLVDIDIIEVGKQRQFTGVWQSDLPDDRKMYFDRSWEDFLKLREAEARGRSGGQKYQLVDVEAYREQGQQRFAGIWKRSDERSSLWMADNLEELLRKSQEFLREGLRLEDLELLDTPSGQKFLGLWLPGTTSRRIFTRASYQEFLAKCKEYDLERLTLIDLDVHPGANNSLLYSGIWSNAKPVETDRTYKFLE